MALHHLMFNQKYKEVLWKDFRNGIAHGFSVCNGGFEGNANDAYFSPKKVSNKEYLELNITKFLEELRARIQ